MGGGGGFRRGVGGRGWRRRPRLREMWNSRFRLRAMQLVAGVAGARAAGCECCVWRPKARCAVGMSRVSLTLVLTLDSLAAA